MPICGKQFGLSNYSLSTSLARNNISRKYLAFDATITTTPRFLCIWESPAICRRPEEGANRFLGNTAGLVYNCDSFKEDRRSPIVMVGLLEMPYETTI